MAVGRISGPLLKANLLRNGVDLAFENDLLYLDVHNLRVGIKTNTPSHELTVNGTTRTTNLVSSNQADLGGITISGSTINSNTTNLNLVVTNTSSVVYQKQLKVDKITINNNVISTNEVNTDLELQPNGLGKVKVYGDTTVYGNLHATGNITADGDIQIGDQATDSVVFNAQVSSDFIPKTTSYYDIGKSDRKWSNLWASTINASTLNVNNLTVDLIDLSARQGKIYYVSINGSDTKSGTHQNDTFLTIKKALSVANAGDTVFIYPGIYEEIFPLTIPSGVAVKGIGLRSVTIRPTTGTFDKDAFLLNGETTVEDLTITGFKFNATNNTGYAFRFASGFTVTTRSPYIRNITVITAGSTITPSDPRGFASGDAGRGAYLDGSVATSSSKEATCLFHSATFITPGVDAIVTTNGTRIEWLNSFTYFANRSMYLYSSNQGFAGIGKTRIKIPNKTGSWQVGDTVTYYDTNGTTVLASGVIANVDSDFINLTGRCLGFETINDRPGKIVYANGDAKLSIAQKKFGASSLVLDGTGDFINVASQNDFAYGTGDFTIEFFWRPTVLGSAQVLLDCRTTGNDTAIYLEMNAAGNIRLFVSNAYRITSSVACTAGTFNHIALFRVGGVTKLAVNGTITPTTYSDTTNYPARPFRMGASWTGSSPSNGYIDELRVAKGVTKYTTSVTVPTAPLTGDLDTVLLLHFDGTNNSTTFVDDGVTYQDIRSSSGGTANSISFADYSDFGTEVRSIASASVYGNYGIYGDGDGVIAYLIGHNVAYIGNGKEVTNDSTTVIQANEIVEINRAKIYYQSVDHKGDFRVGEYFYVNQQTGEVTFGPSAVTLGSNLTFDDGLGNITYIDATKIETGNFRISGNTIRTLSQDFNILSATGQINLQSDVSVTGNLGVTGDVTIGGNIIIGDQPTDSINFVAGITSDITPKTNNFYDLGTSSLNWKRVYAQQAFIAGLTFSSNSIQPTTSGSNLTLTGNGTGKVYIEGVSVQNNTVGTDSGDLVLQPGTTGIVRIDSTQSLLLPKGTDLQRPLSPVAGMIRWNTDRSRYEGYDGSNWIQLNGVSDLDGNTKITAELTPGANDNTIRFYVDGNVVSTVTSDTFTVQKLKVDDTVINNNSIGTTGTSDLTLQATGTGSVIVQSFRFKDNTITNVTANAITEFVQTGTGYVKFGGTGAVVLPKGTDAERPGVVEIGMTRYNTEDQRVEVYTGTDWVGVQGPSGGVTRYEAEENAIKYALTLG